MCVGEGEGRRREGEGGRGRVWWCVVGGGWGWGVGVGVGGVVVVVRTGCMTNVFVDKRQHRIMGTVSLWTRLSSELHVTSY